MRNIHTLLFLILACCCMSALPGHTLSENDAADALRRLDNTLKHRLQYIARQQARIDSLRAECGRNASGAPYAELADAYTGFNNDSALSYLHLAEQNSTGAAQQLARLHMASLLPLAGRFESAAALLESVDTTLLRDGHMPAYYERSRQMYSYLAAFFERYPELRDDYSRKSLHEQRKLLEILKPESDEYLFNDGEYALLTGNTARARIALGELLGRAGLSDKLRARAAHHLSVIARDEADEAARIYYLAESAMADVRSATREVASLQELGTTISAHGDIDRAYAYLSTALTNAVECGADVRMLETARSLPVIEQAYSRKAAGYRQATKWVMAGMGILVLILVGVLLVLRREMHRMRQLQESLRTANRTKEAYMSRFLTLCSLYMDKLKQFSKIVTRKIGAGQTDDLYRMAKNGKFVEEQSGDFYEIFDDAFLHIYPTFVEEVNNLLRPEERIGLKSGEGLNTDMRILAFMRLGVEDTASIAKVLNYSVNTIYSYRNRLRARAIDRDNFERNVMRIGT